MTDQKNVNTFTKPWCPDVCPITGRPFFMWIGHWKTGTSVPTYGGPFDSYTLPTKGEDGSFECEHYDHDRGGWLIDEIQDLGLKLVDDQSFVVKPDHPRYNEIEDFAKAATALEAPAAVAAPVGWSITRKADGSISVRAPDGEAWNYRDATSGGTDSAFIHKLLSAIIAAPALEAPAAPAIDVSELAISVCQRVAELPDRNSPEGWPDAMLVTIDELGEIVRDEIMQALNGTLAAAKGDAP